METNNICRVLQQMDVVALRKIAPLINWTEQIEFNRFVRAEDTKSVLYENLSEEQLVSLLHPNMLCKYSEEIPFSYAFEKGRMDFLRQYIELFKTTYPTQIIHSCDTLSVKAAVYSCVLQNYDREYGGISFDVSSKKSINDWYDMVETILDLIEPQKNYNIQNLKEDLEALRQQSLFLIGSSTVPKVLLQEMLTYAVCNMEVDHMIGTVYETAIAKILERIFEVAPGNIYYDRNTQSAKDQKEFEVKSVKIIAQQQKIVGTMSVWADAGVFKINKRMSHSMLSDLANRCPVMFLWAKEHFPKHKFEIEGKKYSYKEIEGIYSYSYLLHKKKASKPDVYALAEDYEERVKQYRRLGYKLPTVKDFVMTIVPVEVKLASFPGLKNTMGDLQREKFNLEMGLQTPSTRGVYKL